mmetsp:Transcript_22922/g.64954  ORF Transcript_22922/g.64954 Transcript_22922/m.64954 type:complete len:328 (+) Transcript_22922:615-1598(+)
MQVHRADPQLLPDWHARQANGGVAHLPKPVPQTNRDFIAQRLYLRRRHIDREGVLRGNGSAIEVDENVCGVTRIATPRVWEGNWLEVVAIAHWRKARRQGKLQVAAGRHQDLRTEAPNHPCQHSWNPGVCDRRVRHLCYVQADRFAPPQLCLGPHIQALDEPGLVDGSLLWRSDDDPEVTGLSTDTTLPASENGRLPAVWHWVPRIASKHVITSVHQAVRREVEHQWGDYTHLCWWIQAGLDDERNLNVGIWWCTCRFNLKAILLNNGELARVCIVSVNRQPGAVGCLDSPPDRCTMCLNLCRMWSDHGDDNLVDAVGNQRLQQSGS